MRNFITWFSRIFVGLLFIVSGLIKLNDPVGFSYKLAEYFGESVLNLPFLIPIALPLAVFIVIFEAILGVMLLVGYQPKFTVRSLLLMIVFFTFLTFYSAYFNKVTDCGCFGDALKLTPWQSFWKDVVLLIFIVILFINRKFITPLMGRSGRGIVVGVALAACIFMGYYVLNHLPIIDFRAYKTGTNIPEGMSIPEGAPQARIEMTFIYKVNGENREFKEADLMNLPEGAEFVDRRDVVLDEGYVPPIHDFTMELEGSDYTDEILAMPKVLMFTVYDLDKSSETGMEKLEALHQSAKAKGYKVLALTSSGPDKIAAIKARYGHTFDYYFCDATTIKTIERANPSLVVLERGTITQKFHHNDSDNLKL